LWFIFAQAEGGDFGIVEEVVGKKAKFYNLEGILGVWWGKDRAYYRGEAALQMQYDEGFYGRLSVISFNDYDLLSPSVRIKELYVEKAYDNGLDVKFGLGPLFWENGVVFGDYLGGNPFLEIFYGREIWVNLLLYKVLGNLGVGFRTAVDMGNFALTLYGIYDTTRLGYLGTSLNLELPFLRLSLEATGMRMDENYEGAYIFHTYFEGGRWFVGLLSHSFSRRFVRLRAQGLTLDPERSPFFGVSTPITYSFRGIPWTYPQNTSSQLLRFGFNHKLNEDWVMMPMFDVGLFQSPALDLKNGNSLFADGHLVFRWTDTYFAGLSFGALMDDDSPKWSVALYSVKNFSF